MLRDKNQMDRGSIASCGTGGSQASTSPINQGERIMLPRPCDLVGAVAELASSKSAVTGTLIQLLGIDISDAFHQVPNHPEGRHLTAVAILGLVFLFFVLVFGSNCAPTVRGR